MLNKDAQPAYGEEIPPKPPQRWHDAIRSLPGVFLEEGVFESSLNLFDTEETERSFLYYFISVDGKDKYGHLEPGIYIGATIAPGVFEQRGGETFQGIENELLFLLLKDSKTTVTMPAGDLAKLSTENQPIPEHVQEAEMDIGNAIEVKPYISFDISNQTEIPYEFMTYYKVSSPPLRHAVSILSNPNNSKSVA